MQAPEFGFLALEDGQEQGTGKVVAPAFDTPVVLSFGVWPVHRVVVAFYGAFTVDADAHLEPCELGDGRVVVAGDAKGSRDEPDDS